MAKWNPFRKNKPEDEAPQSPDPQTEGTGQGVSDGEAPPAAPTPVAKPTSKPAQLPKKEEKTGFFGKFKQALQKTVNVLNTDLRDIVKGLGGAHVVYDVVGGDLFNAALRACRPEARILTIGFASGDVPQIAANHILVKNISVMGFYWGGYLTFKPEVLTQSLTKLFEMHGAGKLRPHVSHSFPLEQADEGLEVLRKRQSTGKVVITL